MTTDLTDFVALPLTQAGRDYLTKRLDATWAERHDLTSKRDTLLREVDSLNRVIDLTDRSIAMLQAELDGPVSSLPPLVDLADEEPEQELPFEREAHQAVAERAGRAPYGPATVPDLPPFPAGRGDEFPSTGVRISAPGWTGPAMQNGAVR